MRRAIVALVAIALVSPSAVLAAAPGRAADPTPAPAQAAPKKMERIAFPRRHRQIVRRHAHRKKSSAARIAKKPVAPQPPPAIEGAQPGSQAAAPPACLTNPNLDGGRRCLRLVKPAPLPTPLPAFRPSIEAYVPSAPFASPSRTWLGAFSKRIVTQLIEIAEVAFADPADWRGMMADEIQSQLERASSKEQQSRRNEPDRSGQHIGQAAPKAVPGGAQPRRPIGAKT